MRTVITSTGNTLESSIDMRFGRCVYFVVYDTESKSMEFIPNPYKDLDEDAGSLSVKLVASRNVSKIVSGEFGLRIKPLLDSMKIQMIVVKDLHKKVYEIIALLDH